MEQSLEELCSICSAAERSLAVCRPKLDCGEGACHEHQEQAAHRSIRSATLTKSSSTMPRVVMAGLPMRTPPGTMADLSPGTLFLFSVT